MLRDLFLLPNLITLSRILLSPVIMVVFDRPLWLYLTLGYCAVSDFADGFVARRLGLRTVLGATLDPIADKILVASFLGAALLHQILEPWMLLALVIRDIYILLLYPCYIWLYPKQQTALVGARMGGKVTTTLQFVCLGLLAFLPLSVWRNTSIWRWQSLPFLLLYPVSLWAMIDYTRHYTRLFFAARAREKSTP